MTNMTLKDLMISYLQSDYTRFAKILYNYTLHIDRIYNNFIININERNQQLENINENIKIMNDLYNNKLKLLKSNNYIESEELSINNNINDKENTITNVSTAVGTIYTAEYIKNIVKLCHFLESLNIKEYNNITLGDFTEINSRLLKNSLQIGFYNIDDALNLIIGSRYLSVINNESEFKRLLHIYNSIYVPLSYTITKNDTDNINEYKISSKYLDEDHIPLLDNYVMITVVLPIKKITINFKGYFINDFLNIIVRTSQISNTFIHERKKILNDTIDNNKNKSITEKFRISYIKNLTIGKILSYDENEFYTKITNDYEEYLRLNKLSFKNLHHEFLDTTNSLSVVKKQYNIIKLYLIGGTDDNINMAGLLFGMIKEKKYGSDILANIIYNNLSYKNQIKLKKSSISIKNEMDKIKNIAMNEIDIKEQIVACKNMPLYVKKIAFDKLEEMKGNIEHYKQKTYIDILLNFPWIKMNDDNKTQDHLLKKDNKIYEQNNDNNNYFETISGNLKNSVEFLNRMKQILDDKVYGHDECKSVMQELFGKWITNINSSGKAIGLVGPPGIGKTLIAKSLGDALGIPLVQINLGGMEDRCILAGHSYTYNSAQPGLIIRKMVEAGQSRCIMYFDELDKACPKHGINEIFNVLIHVTDPNTNMEFSDDFFNEITFRLDKVLFVFSYNDSEKIDRILLDRMEKIEVKPYTINDKIVIVNKFLLKEICNEIGLKENIIKINKEDIEYIIENYTFEAGVRELKRKLETLYLKINLDRIYQRGIYAKSNDNNINDNNINDNIILTREKIDEYLGKQNLTIKKIHNTAQIGIINGLYATTSGTGGIIPILIYDNYIGDKNEFTLRITGNQGKVMTETTYFAFNTAMSLIKDEYKNIFLEECKYGLQVHTTDASTNKEGPSASGATTVAFISKILKKKIRQNIAMTGEIDMRGKLSIIGGLTYKLNGAEKAGITIVFIPKENKNDLIKIFEKDKELEKKIEVHEVDNIYEILPHVLLEENNEIFDPEKYLVPQNI